MYKTRRGGGIIFARTSGRLTDIIKLYIKIMNGNVGWIQLASIKCFMLKIHIHQYMQEKN